MAIYKRSSRGLWLPGGQPKIDWSNPITAGLVGCWVVTGEGGANPVIRDLVTQGVLTSIKAAKPTILSGPFGPQAIDGGALANGAGWQGVAQQSQKAVSAFSILWSGSITTGSGAFPPFLSVGQGSGASGYTMALRRNSNIMSLSWFNGGSFINIDTGIVSNGFYSVLGSVKLGANALIYRNGLFTSSTPAAAGTLTYNPPDSIAVGAFSSGVGVTQNAGGKMSVGLLWNRQLNSGESALISADPTNFLAFPGDMNSLLLGGAAMAAFLASLSDGSITSDGFSVFMNSSGLLSDASLTSDLLSQNLSAASAMHDTSATSDTTSSAAGMSAALSDTAATSDVISGVLLAAALLSDNSATSDLFALLSSGSFVFNFSDSVSTSDSFASTAQLVASILDSAAASDLLIPTISVSISDTATTSDSLSSIASFMATLQDAIDTSDIVAFTGIVALLAEFVLPAALAMLERTGEAAIVNRIGKVAAISRIGKA